MTAVTTTSATEYPALPEPELTREQIVARAEALSRGLISRQVETEQRTYYAADTHRAFMDAGFYRILVPRRYGGYEFGADTFLRVAAALARGCPSTAWMYVFGAAHAVVVATLFGEEAQADFFAGGDFICPAAVAPTGSAERAPDGGWIISGTWNYCSGSPYATHFLGHTLLPPTDGGQPAPLLFVIPRHQWRRLDDWGAQLGLKGSGSHSITVDRAHIPENYALPTHMSLVNVTNGTAGLALHGNPEYAGGPLSFMLFQLGALAVGMAKGALDAYEDLMRSRMTVFLPIIPRVNDSDYQLKYGEASGMIAAAEAALFGAVGQWADICAAGPEGFTREQELRLAMISREAVRLSWRAVEGHLFPTAGSSSVRNGERVERVWRDMSTLHSHAGVAVFLSSLANREFARAHFGVE
jgi:3-hydroxy-9,10-secoandrosta-1,3,5(10)-triene-9,17-dione monooxygenase